MRSLTEIGGQSDKAVSIFFGVGFFGLTFQFQVKGESTFGFRLRGSNLESVDSAGFVKITKNDPDARIDTMIFQYLGLSEWHSG